jgi:simple sugar transport system substrate-binding protein
MHFKAVRNSLIAVAISLVMILSACAPAVTPVTPATAIPSAVVPTTVPTAIVPTIALQPFVFGMILVGSKDDQGWSEATYNGGLYVEQKIPNTKMIYLENVYTGSPSYPGQTASQLADTLVAQGAKLIIFNSDDMKDEALKFAKANPSVYVIGVSDDWTWQEGKNYVDSPNQVDIMGRMEYGKMIAGCAAALTTKTGMIGYLGPLINDETRRLVSSAFLGAKYCWAQSGKDPSKLVFTVTWIGFWFNIPGVTTDPTQVADNFYNTGYDVVISGIDTPEAITEATKYSGEGKSVWAIPYDYSKACDKSPDVCLGVPYFNWGVAFAQTIQTAISGTWKENFQWNAPDWTNINNPDTSAVGFVKGAGLSPENSAALDGFIAKLAGGLNLWSGEVKLQDGTEYLTIGQTASDTQIWYLPLLVMGVQGDSVTK